MRERVARFSAHYVALHNAGVKRKGSIPLADLVTRTILPRSPDAEAFWRDFRRHAGIDHDNYVVGSFGDNPKMATELADLVIAVIKRAAASLARDYGDGREPMPKPGDFVIMLDGDGSQRFI